VAHAVTEARIIGQWIRNQHPFIGPASDVRDVTEIVLTEINPAPKQQGGNPQSHEP
jgi:hypothetical protein